MTGLCEFFPICVNIPAAEASQDVWVTVPLKDLQHKTIIATNMYMAEVKKSNAIDLYVFSTMVMDYSMEEQKLTCVSNTGHNVRNS